MEAERLREVDLHLTNRCNLTCAHCSVDSGPGRSSWPEMSLPEWLRVVNDAASIGCRYADLTGGEPVLYAGVEKLIESIVAAGMSLELQSNGILLTRERLDELRAAGLRTLVISLDGMEEQHDLMRGRPGTYQRATQAIRDGVSMGFQVRVTRVVKEPDLTVDLGTFLQALEQWGVSHLSLNLFSPVTSEHFRSYRKPDAASWMTFAEQLERLAGSVTYPITYQVGYARRGEVRDILCEETRCLIERRRWFLVRCDGEVFPCYHFVHRPEMSIGNVRVRLLSSLIETGRWDQYREIQNTPVACTDCSFVATCKGGCPSPGYLQLGRLDVKDPRCEVDDGYIPVCPFVKRKAGTRHMTNIAPYYA